MVDPFVKLIQDAARITTVKQADGNFLRRLRLGRFPLLICPLEALEELVARRNRDFQSLRGFLAWLAVTSERLLVGWHRMSKSRMSVQLPSLGSALDSALEKIRRADRHLGSLKQSIERFKKRDPYPVGWEQSHSDILVQEATVRVIPTPQGHLWIPNAGPVLQVIANSTIATLSLSDSLQPPVLQWGTIIGDIVHNLSSALDNLVWELVQINLHPPVLPTGANHRDRAEWERKERAIGFPFCDEAKKWPNMRDRCLFFVDPSLYAVFEEMQPFYAWQHRREDPKHHPLWVLHKLWNRDKHHTVNLTTVALDYKNIRVRLLNLPDAPQLRTEVIRLYPSRPIEGKTEVADIRVHFPQPVAILAQVNMDVNADFTLHIRFGHGAPGFGDDVIDTLTRARNQAVAFLNRFV